MQQKGEIEMEEVLITYVKPELVSLAIVLYFVGVFIKKTEAISDKWIPLILCTAGIVLAAIYVVAVSLPFSSSGETLMAVFTAVVQGVLCAALSTFVNQLIKQSKKDE